MRKGSRKAKLIVLGVATAFVAAGGAAIGLGVPAWLAGAVAAVSTLAGGTAVARVYQGRDDMAVAGQRRRQVLDELQRAVYADRADVLAMLRPDGSPVPLRARSRQLHQLAAWCADESATPVLIMSGPAGVGKSRLALEFGLRLPQNWTAGWLHAGSGADALEAVLTSRQSTVILVDEADGRADLLSLLESLAEHQDPTVRVVLVTRSGPILRSALSDRLEERHAWIVSGATELDLGPEGGPDDWTRWFTEAIHAFSEALDLPAPVLAEWFPWDTGAGVQSFMVVQAQALLAVLSVGQEHPDPRNLPFRQVAEALMTHEQRRWRSIAATWDWGVGGPPSPAVQERCVAALCLLGADGEAEAEQILRRIPAMRGAAPERLAAIASWISTLYPTPLGPAPRIRPDMIGEWFVVNQLTAHPELSRDLQIGLTDDQSARALSFLARTADRFEAAGELFAEFDSGDLRRRIMAAVFAAMSGETGRYLLDAVIADQVQSVSKWTLDQLTELQDLLPNQVLPLTHAVIADRLVTAYRTLAANDAAYRSYLAAALDKLGIRLDALARYQEALRPARESVSIYRTLATANPNAHQPGLAAALDNLGARLAALRRYLEALNARQESVSIYRTLATANPHAHQPGLALALDNLGTELYHLGRYQQAAEAAQESVAIHRALAAAKPTIYRPGLATGLDHLGVELYHLGRYQEADEAAQEAVADYRILAAVNPTAYKAGLADALNNLASDVGQLGRYQEALAAGQEAVTLFRSLATSNPGAHRRGLATALNNLSIHLDELGRHQDGLEAAREAVTLYRALAAADPAFYQPGLAQTLKNYGTGLCRLDRYQEALRPTREAITLYRTLAARDRATHEPELALALRNLGGELAHLGRYKPALRLTREAITRYRALASRNPALYQPELVHALDNLSILFDQRGRHQEAIATQSQSVQIYRELAASNPDMYQPEYRRRLGAIRRTYDQRGMRDEAIMYGLFDSAE